VIARRDPEIPDPAADAAPTPSAVWPARAAEIERVRQSNPKLAVRMAGAWMREERAAGAGEGYAWALRTRAHAFRFVGRYEVAVSAYEAAEEHFLKLGQPLEAARTQIGHVTALRFLGRYDEAAALARRSRADFLARGCRLEAAKQSNNLGTVYRPMGRLNDALAAYRAARPIFRQLGERGALADVEQNIGNVLGELGRYDEALAHLKRAERLRRALGLPAAVALTLLNIGVLSRRRGEYGAALQALTEARRIDESLAYERGLVAVNLELLPVLAALNLTTEARDTATRAISALRALDMPLELGMALVAAGRLAGDEEDWDSAQQMVREAHALFERTGNTLWASMAQLLDAEIVARRPESEEDLIAALKAGRAATETFRKSGAVDHIVEGQMLEGMLLAHLGQFDEALDSVRSALAVADSLEADHLRYRAHSALGDMLSQEDPDTALDSYRAAVTCLQAVRGRARADDLKRAFLADKSDLYERTVALLLRRRTPERIAEAYRLVESSKSRSLIEEIAERATDDAGTASGDVPREIRPLVRRIDSLRTRLATVYSRAFAGNETNRGSGIGDLPDGQTIGRLEQELAEATRELQLRRRPDAFQAQTASDEASELVCLPPGTVLLEYYGIGDRLIAFVRRDATLDLRVLGQISELEAQLDSLNLQLQRVAQVPAENAQAALPRWRRGVDACLQALAQDLIAPLADTLVGAEQLVIIPHGPLHGLPFHALAGYDGTYLADQVAISYAPSASVYERCVRDDHPSGERVLLFGVGGDDLPWVEEELGEIAQIWPEAQVRFGKRATRAALRRQAGQFDVLHVATHAVARADNPSFSSIRLADAWLTANDLADLARGARLVTLAACETGVGAVSPGDEVLGLTRGLLAAGCTAAVASLWPVSDRTTALLMPRFYSALRDGHGPSEAMRRAMHDVREAFDHPYFWAPFVVVGDGGRQLTAPGAS
jgi:CHAT domain-containing protein/tetratricopeptide (TPR) repeat protein